MRVMIIGVAGMLGHALFKVFSEDPRHEVWGTARDEGERSLFAEADQIRVLPDVDVLNQDAVVETFNKIRPEIVINCVGLVKQLAISADPLSALPINAMLPHRLVRLCDLGRARLIHVSTDCVFSGHAGGYRESDISDAVDLYGKSKFIGELHEWSHAVTLRTSIIGHELNSRRGLVEWFLSQNGQVKGYANAVFSGLPTVELARVMRDVVLPRPELSGLYHVSATPISKLDLLRLIADVYGKDIEIVADNSLTIDRSLNSERFTEATGYVAPDWPELITLMHDCQ